MSKRVTVIPGDGIGPEVAAAMMKCVDATGVAIDWEESNVEWGDSAGNVAGLPQSLLDSINSNRIAIKGPITTPVGKGFRSLNVTLRQVFDLYACVRPCKSIKGVRSRYDDVDLVIVRENTEDLYAGLEFKNNNPQTDKLIQYLSDEFGMRVDRDAAIGLKPISVTKSERVIRFAFDYALQRQRTKLTAVHKANIMKYTDGLFGKLAEEISHKYPGVEYEERLVDNLCMQLVMRPEQFDILVLPNLYGDIVSDLCAGLIGGLGVAPGANIGKEIAVFEATHGSAPKYAGLDKANPTALILSGAMMLDYMGEAKAAEALRKAVETVIAEGKRVTYDFKEKRDDPSAVGTSAMTEAIVEKVKTLRQG